MIGNRYSGKKVHLISVGGGTASTLELPIHVIDKYGPENTQMFICALAGESPDLWRMVDWVERKTGVRVVRVAWQPRKREIYHNMFAKYLIDPAVHMYKDIWDSFYHARVMGNTRIDPCSRQLKRETAKSFVLDHYDPQNTVMHVGIGAHEIDRMISIKRSWSKTGIEVRAELADREVIGTSADRAQKLLGWTPFVYSWGGSHNNCNGFCVKAGHAQMAKLLYYNRDVYLYHENKEKEFRAEFETDATIMRDRKMIKGKRFTYPLTLEDFRIRMEQKWSNKLFPPFDDLEDQPGCSFCDSVA